MFNNIAAQYDFLNHFLSLGIDRIWRRKTIQSLAAIQPQAILDVATGTADLALEALKLQPKRIVGIDISKDMLAKGQEKIKPYADVISLQLGDSENLPFHEADFDAVTVAFGVRNFENLEKGLSEMYRVLRKGGRVAILEFSRPHNFPVKQIFNFYFKNILPTIGKFVSKDNRAYTYLPESVAVFPEGKDFCDILLNIGFKNIQCKTLTFGISTLYIADK
ncbi:MAG: bifunctional demethylmenaquinone methyltransferase/2-methoxy-6-polyprenyl-1,4-benzoquinol methylase UbiE [Bacteroidetes bacterium]|nr:bifunctional demethylmenaquinone methyltransferase/2-methoxy-6-polyprenyl-1,4-benzoquinol methylase UbiE [Bacteroidota bacterium]MCB9042709.1 bifunctional demethylmenaquinone methyltransferase/2-methoxy-6-polyprenyl-1,4-benzoquinol methylase UbiE [Chitinophagales bacterium]